MSFPISASCANSSNASDKTRIVKLFERLVFVRFASIGHRQRPTVPLHCDDNDAINLINCLSNNSNCGELRQQAILPVLSLRKTLVDRTFASGDHGFCVTASHRLLTEKWKKTRRSNRLQRSSGVGASRICVNEDGKIIRYF